METKKIKQIGSKYLNGRRLEIFSFFIAERFPQEQSVSYVEEWAKRFSFGLANVESYMDSKSKEVFLKVIDSVGDNPDILDLERRDKPDT